MTRFALRAAEIFDGETVHRGAALVVADGRIEAIVRDADLPGDCPVEDLGDGVLAPGFIDIQVNGGGGVLFNDRPDVEGIRAISAAHIPHGTTAMLPTVITDAPAVTRAAIEAATAAVAAGVPGCLGIHVEGPFISHARKGAHDPALIRPMAEADLAALLATTVRPLLITVAPESVSPDQVRRLAEGGITVSVGHSDASFEAASAAFAAGARCATHLFNAMSQLGSREPGVVGAALDAGDVWCGIIADGHHVHPAAIAAAIRGKRGPARLIAISDAMPTAGWDGDTFNLNGREVRLREGKLTLANGTLAGCHLTMDAAVRYLVGHVGVARDEALRMASLYPATLLGIEVERGCLAPGSRADLVHLSDALAVRGVWIGGERHGADEAG